MIERYVCLDGFIDDMDVRIARAVRQLEKTGKTEEASHVEEMWDIVARTMQTEDGEKVRPLITAHWIFQLERDAYGFKKTGVAVCSACRGKVPYDPEEWNVPDMGDFCPYCGAEMSEKETWEEQ